MKLLLFILLLSPLLTLGAVEITINISDDMSYTYIDNNNDGLFDSLKVIDKGELSLIKLEIVEYPSLRSWEDAEYLYEVRLVNYNYVRRDAYFQIRLKMNDKIVGYYEHIMGKEQLIWRAK